ncbi:MAG: DsbA family protein [Chloroflexi bacterium]|nr:DsbA family protein [Chloroflexota bacterium]
MVERLTKEYDIVVGWLAFKLHPEIPPEGAQLLPQIRARFGGMSERLKERAREAGRDIVTPDIIPNTRWALEASEYARQTENMKSSTGWSSAGTTERARTLGEWDVLRAAAEEVGLESEAMQRETDSGKYRGDMARQIADARALGITGVPTHVFDDKYAVVGEHPCEVFQQVMEQLAAQVQTNAGR